MGQGLPDEIAFAKPPHDALWRLGLVGGLAMAAGGHVSAGAWS